MNALTACFPWTSVYFMLSHCHSPKAVPLDRDKGGSSEYEGNLTTFLCLHYLTQAACTHFKHRHRKEHRAVETEVQAEGHSYGSTTNPCIAWGRTHYHSPLLRPHRNQLWARHSINQTSGARRHQKVVRQLWESSRVWKRQQWTLQTWGHAFNNCSSCTINDQGTRSPQSLSNAGVT